MKKRNMQIKNILFYILIILTGICPMGFAENYSINTILNNPLLEEAISGQSQSSDPDILDDNHKQVEAKNINIDTKMMYGEYNNIFSSFSLVQNQKNLIYQLNSEFKRSNDFGYKNSSFHKSEIGFTGKLNITDLWEFMPYFEVNDQSHGMFNKSLYSREEKGKLIVNFKNEYRPTPTRWFFNIGGAQYAHRLVSNESIIDPVNSDFNKINVEIARDYIWSATNKLGLKIEADRYFYSEDGTPDDTNLKNKITFGFSVTEFLKIGLNPTISWNKDYEANQGWFPGGEISLSSIGRKNATFEINYNYNLDHFKPEDFNFEKKYVNPTYVLPPSESHHLNLKAEVDLKFKGESFFSVKSIKIKGSGNIEDKKKFYNYYVKDELENVLRAETLPVVRYNGKADLFLDLRLFSQDKFKCGLNYEYAHYVADKNITYQPEHVLSGFLKYKESRWQLEWENKVMDEVYIDPEKKEKLDSALIGSLGLQLRTYKEFFIYAKINNLYNNNYTFRDGYPEPGRTILGGLRIII